jgi:hypothetical protein
VEGLLIDSASAELDILPLVRPCLTDAAARSGLASLVAG